MAFDPSDGEIMGGFGFGDDQFPEAHDYYTDFSLYSNGSMALNRDPYLPIENEHMGRDYASSEYGSSDPTTTTVYPYRNVYTTKDPMMRDDYFLDSPGASARRASARRASAKNASSDISATSQIPGLRKKLDNTNTVKEYLMTNFPTFHSIDPMTSGPSSGSGLQKPVFGLVNEYFLMMFMVLIFMMLIITSYFQHLQIMKLYKVLKINIAK